MRVQNRVFIFSVSTFYFPVISCATATAADRFSRERGTAAETETECSSSGRSILCRISVSRCSDIRATGLAGETDEQQPPPPPIPRMCN